MADTSAETHNFHLCHYIFPILSKPEMA